MKQISIVLLAGFINVAFVISTKCYGEICPTPLIYELHIPDDGNSYRGYPAHKPSILVGADKLFYQDGQAGPLRVFDAETLKPLWSWPEPRKYPAYYLWNEIRSFPVSWGPDPNDHFYEWDITLGTVYENAVVINAENHRFSLANRAYALDVSNGKTRWGSRILSANFSGQCRSIGSRLVIPFGYSLIAYSPADDEIEWEIKYDYENRKITRHIIDEKKAGEKTILYPLIWGVDDKIFSIDAYSGQILWMEIPIQGLRTGFACSDGDGGFGYVVTEPVDDIVCFCHQMRKSVSILIAFDVKKRSVLWEYRDYPDLYFVHDNGDVVIAKPGPVGKRGLVCLDARTGKEKWECILSYSTIVFTVSDKVIYCWDRKLLKQQKDYFWDGNVYAINRKTGVIIWKYKSYDYFIGEPVLYKDKVYVLSTKREEYHNGIIRIFDHKATLEAINSICKK